MDSIQVKIYKKIYFAVLGYCILYEVSSTYHFEIVALLNECHYPYYTDKYCIYHCGHLNCAGHLDHLESNSHFHF